MRESAVVVLIRESVRNGFKLDAISLRNPRGEDAQITSSVILGVESREDDLFLAICLCGDFKVKLTQVSRSGTKHDASIDR